MKMTPPTQCLLWKDPGRVIEDRWRYFKMLKRFREISHALHALVKCRECGQLYFYEFFEEIDWSGDGNDPSWVTWVPVETDDDIASLLRHSPGFLMNNSPSFHEDPKQGGENVFHWAARDPNS